VPVVEQVVVADRAAAPEAGQGDGP
jgi:hypothetical protein